MFYFTNFYHFYISRFSTYTLFFALFSLFFLSGCAQIELASYFGKKLSGSHVHSIGTYKVGSPYTVNGLRYYPAVDYNYDRTGIASWYGADFHGKKTANGEIYDQNALTAAHKTLPLPSIVRVTNLENGRSLIIRVNDRGPYARGRIIDLSKRSAELLGFKNKGTAKVRVQVLERESRQVAQMAKRGYSTSGVEVPMNNPSYRADTTTSSANRYAQNYTSANKMTTNGKNPIHIKNGRVFPNRVISKGTIIKPPHIFVQAGAFSNRETAMKFASSLDSYGRAQISAITVNNKKFYRVRIPVGNTSLADSLLDRLTKSGYRNAIIVVD